MREGLAGRPLLVGVFSEEDVLEQQLTPEDVLAMVRGEGIEIVDLRFCDLPGMMQHFSVPAHQLTVEAFSEGYGFDGSSIRGFQEIQESDMILVPDPASAVRDPFRQHPTLNLNCWVKDPITGEAYTRDPRYVAKKAEEYLRTTGVADTAFFGPEAEFFIFDNVQYDQNQYSSMHKVDSVEGQWNTARDEGPNLGHKIRYKQGYFPLPPADHFQDLRSEMILTMERCGIEIEVPAPRGGHRWSGRDRHEVRHAPDHGRQAHALQVHREERGSRSRQNRHLHAQAFVPGQRLGYARALVTVERRHPALLQRDGIRRSV